MNKIFKYSPYIIGVIIGVIMVVYKIPISVESIINIFCGAFLLYLIIYSLLYVYIKYRIKLFLTNKISDLDKLEKTINSIPSNQLKYYYIIMLSLGYSVKKDFEKALSLLENIDISKQNSKIKANYFNNKALFLYKVGKKDEAKIVIEANKELFDKYLSDITMASALQDTIETINESK